MPQDYSALTFSEWETAQAMIPHSPSVPVSNHTSPANQSSFGTTKKSPIWGMRSGPPQHYNPYIVEPDALRTSPLQERRSGFSVARVNASVRADRGCAELRDTQF
jgi:hypothetical protein